MKTMFSLNLSAAVFGLSRSTLCVAADDFLFLLREARRLITASAASTTAAAGLRLRFPETAIERTARE